MQPDQLPLPKPKPLDLIDYTRRIYYMLVAGFVLIAATNAVNVVRYLIVQNQIAQAQAKVRQEQDEARGMANMCRLERQNGWSNPPGC